MATNPYAVNPNFKWGPLEGQAVTKTEVPSVSAIKNQPNIQPTTQNSSTGWAEEAGAIDTALKDSPYKAPDLMTTEDTQKETEQNLNKLNGITEPEKAKQHIYKPEKETDQSKIDELLANEEQDPVTKQLDELQNNYLSQQKQAENDLNSLRLAQDEQYNSLISGIRQQYAQRVEEMKNINKASLGGQTLLGTRSGRQRYAPELQTSILTNEEQAGLGRITALENEMNQLILKATTAKTENDIKMLNDSMNRLDKNYEQQVNQVLKLNELARQKNQDLMEKSKFEFDIQKYQQDLMATEKPMVVAPGSSIYDPSTGEFLGTAPERPSDPMDYIKSVGDSLLQYNPQTGNFDVVYSKPKVAESDLEGKPNSYKEWFYAGQPGTYQEWVKKTGLRPLPPTQATTLSEGFQIPLVTKSIEEILEGDKSKLFGPIEGLKAKNPWDVAHKTIDDDLRRASQVIGRYMEGGVLRKEDEEKYRSMLPQITDTVDVAKDKLKGVKDLLAQKSQQYLDDYEAAGFDVSGFVGRLPGTESNQTPSQKLDDYYLKNPSQRNYIDSLDGMKNPNTGQIYTDEEKLQILGFNSVDSDTDSAIRGASVKIGAGWGVTNNNPGNLRFANQVGATMGGGNFAKFSTPEAGFKALIDDLKAKKASGGRLDSNSTLAELIAVYAPKEDMNDPASYAQTVAKNLGITVNTPIGKIDTVKLAKAIAKHESQTIIS